MSTLNARQTRLVGGLAIALLYEVQMAPKCIERLDRSLGLPLGTTEQALEDSPHWEEHPTWGRGTFKPVRGLFKCGYDYPAALYVGDLARSFPLSQTSEYTEALLKWFRHRCYKANLMGLEVIPELSTQAKSAEQAMGRIKLQLAEHHCGEEETPAVYAVVEDDISVEHVTDNALCLSHVGMIPRR